MIVRAFPTAFLGASALALTACAGMQEPESSSTAMMATSEPIEFEFIAHLTAEMIEQDVFVERTAGSSEVYRVSLAEKEMYVNAPAFATAEPVHHDPMNPDANGPHPKGQPLGFTLAEWLAASGSGTYQCEDGRGEVRATFTDLVPNGVYTMWYFFAANPMPEQFMTYDLPLGARDGSENVFVADADGNATYELTFEPCLQLSGSQLDAGLAIAYHSDGKTYGYDPGAFGENSHVHLFMVFPQG